MDSSGVKFSGGKLVPRSDLRVGTTSGNSCRIKSKHGRDIKVGTWNVRSLYRPGAFQSMVGEVERYGVEVVALQETRWAGEGSLNAGSYTLHYGGSEIHSLGIGFMINRKILSAVKDIKFINERLGLLVVQGRWYKIAIINVHAPTEDKDGEIKDGFYEELEHLVDQLPNDYMKIVVGDFNAKIGKEDIFRPTIGLESLHEESNDNGVRVINFATGKNLIVKSTYFKHKNIHKQTWISPDGGTRNQIDHVLADKRRHTNVLDVRSYRGADCDSDHLFVIAKIRERLSLNKTNGQLFGTKRLNVQGLIEGENGIKYAVEVTNRLAASKEIDESDDNTVDKHWENVRDAIVKSAEATVGFCKRNKNKPWFDEECVKIVKVRNEARITWLAQNTKETRDQFLKIRQEAHNMFKIKKRQYLKRKIEEIDENCKSSNVRGTYMGINNFRKGFQARTEMVKDENDNLVTDTTAVLNTWKNYFDRLLNVESENDREIENFEYHTAEPRINEPTISEVESAIKKLKNHKAPGNDLIPAELIKWGGSRLIEEIQKLIILIWNKEALPEQWKDYTREMVDDKSYLRHINNIPNPGLAQQYTYSALGVTNSPYKRRGPPRGASLLLRDSAVISDFSFGTRQSVVTFHSAFDIRYSIFGIRHSAVTSQTPSPRLSAIRVKVTRPELPHPSANFPAAPEPSFQRVATKPGLPGGTETLGRRVQEVSRKLTRAESSGRGSPITSTIRVTTGSAGKSPRSDTASASNIFAFTTSATSFFSPRTPSPAFPDALTGRILSDLQPQSSDSFHPTSPRSLSPTNSTDSVEFLEEIPPPPPRSYFRILESDTFESLISQFPRVTTASIPQGAYTIGPHYFDPQEIRNAITGRSPTSNIPVFLPNSTHSILVPLE
ncbi:PREDICTED: uncharacterized protein LOC108757184 [Trachymyrmex septentrionalis]|uniref:uncharacterized protein LOC108757184 n=1 Tax=Trachymyrmex septentrionalis TaxID=34720 RepID=UPI00084F3B7E|nr:PREDICTED: uncharacterized protein LOC108757184 [Trachymyrmex septentrionalis]